MMHICLNSVLTYETPVKHVLPKIWFLLFGFVCFLQGKVK